VVGDLFDADALAREDLTEIHLPILEANATAQRDGGRPIMRRVFKVPQPLVGAGG
jgi:hypothetical protein